MYGDAAAYWSLARSFVVDGHFSLAGYGDLLRGYSVPLFLHGVQRGAQILAVDEILLFRIVSALMGAALFTMALPTLISRIFNVQPSLFTTAVFSLLSVAFWHDHFLYSLSDFPALLLLTVGLLCLPRSITDSWDLVSAVTSGVCLALAANARPIYAVSLLAAVVLVGAYLARGATQRRVAAALIAFPIGIAVALLPQARINSRTLGTPSPFAHGRTAPKLPNLYVQQLAWGVVIQRYETNIGPSFPVAVMFLDPAGKALMPDDSLPDPRASIARSRVSVRSYARLVVQHPVFFVLAYSRHLFNGLDVAYTSPYVRRIAPRSALIAFANYVILGLAAVQGLARIRRVRVRDHGWQLAIAATFILAALLAIPTAIECRFMLPIWMLMYGFVVFDVLGGGSALVRPWWTVPVVALCAVACFWLAASTYAHILDAPRFELWSLW